MATPTKFFKGNDLDEYEYCYSRRWFLEELSPGESIKVEGAKPDKDHRWCSNFFEFLDEDDTGCGKHCSAYAPRNGKSGACRFITHCYEPSGEEFTITRKGSRIYVKPIN